MDKKNVLHTEKVSGKDKAYFLDLKKAENGNNYLVIAQSKKKDDETYERIKMILFENEVEKFGEAFVKILMKFKASEKYGQKEVSDEYIQEVRKLFPRAYEPWTQEDDDQLRIMSHEGESIDKMSGFFQRKEGAIIVRMKKLKINTEQAVSA